MSGEAVGILVTVVSAQVLRSAVAWVPMHCNLLGHCFKLLMCIQYAKSFVLIYLPGTLGPPLPSPTVVHYGKLTNVHFRNVFGPFGKVFLGCIAMNYSITSQNAAKHYIFLAMDNGCSPVCH